MSVAPSPGTTLGRVPVQRARALQAPAAAPTLPHVVLEEPPSPLVWIFVGITVAVAVAAAVAAVLILALRG